MPNLAQYAEYFRALTRANTHHRHSKPCASQDTSNSNKLKRNLPIIQPNTNFPSHQHFLMELQWTKGETLIITTLHGEE